MGTQLADDWREELRCIIREALQVAAGEVATCVRRDVREELRAFRIAPVLRNAYTNVPDEIGQPPGHTDVYPEDCGSSVGTPPTILEKSPSIHSTASGKVLAREALRPLKVQTGTDRLWAGTDSRAPCEVVEISDVWEDDCTRCWTATKAIERFPLQNEIIVRSPRRKPTDGSKKSISRKLSQKLSRRSSSRKNSTTSSPSNDDDEPSPQTPASLATPATPATARRDMQDRPRALHVVPTASSDLEPARSLPESEPDYVFMNHFAAPHRTTLHGPLVQEYDGNDNGEESEVTHHVTGMTSREDDSGVQVDNVESLFHKVKPGVGKNLKRQVTTVLSGTSRNASRLYVTTARVVISPMFDYVISLMLLLNAASIGAQVDYMARSGATDIPLVFVVMGWLFVVIFTLEIGLRMFVHRWHFFYMQGWQWNIFDLIVVGLQLTEELLATVVDTLLGELYANFTVARLLRYVRLVRVVRFVRIVRLMRELRTMVASIAGSLRTFLWTIALLLLMIYIIGVYITQVVVDHKSSTDEDAVDPNLNRYFGSLGDSVLSLFQAMSGGVDWDDLVSPLRRTISPVFSVFFAMYIAFAMFVMLNLVTGIFVESAHANIKEDKDLDLVNRVRELFITADNDRSGCITWKEFQNQLGSPHMEEYFRSIDLDLSEARSLFSLLDIHSTGSITSEDFLNGCLRLRGHARAIDLTTLVHNMKRMYKQWLSSSKRIERHVKALSMQLAESDPSRLNLRSVMRRPSAPPTASSSGTNAGVRFSDLQEERLGQITP